MSDYKDTRSTFVRQEIQDLIIKCVNDGKKRIPPEVELAGLLSVSRTMIRDCLDVLEQEGYINRIHGVGTLINKDIALAKSRLDTNVDLYKMIENIGKSPSVLNSEYSFVDADAYLAEKLKVKEGTKLIHISQVIGANMIPVVYCKDYVHDSFGDSAELIKNNKLKSVYKLIEMMGKNKIHMDIAQLSAVTADENISLLMNIEKGTPLVLSQEVGYDIYGEPVLYSEDYFREEILQHKVIHKKIY